jgi:hypothetical protein
MEHSDWIPWPESHETIRLDNLLSIPYSILAPHSPHVFNES